MKFPKMPKISRRMGKKLMKTTAIVVSLAQVALREVERNTRRVK
jgi:hypothetical protein